MPSGGKGPSSQGTITKTQVNPTQEAQLPFLQGGWGAAQDLYQNSPYSYYPGQTLASPNYWQPTGYNELANAGATANNMLPGIQDIFTGLTSGVNNLYNSPAFSGLSDIASGSNAYLQTGAADQAYLRDLAGQAASNPYAAQLAQLQAQAGVHDYGMNSLQNTASGMYLNSNPYLDEMFGSASDAVTRAYQTATAPTTASTFSGAGRYGSGAYANMASQNQQDLGGTLNNLSSNIYGGNYQAERARQDAASQALSALIQQNYGIQGNLTNQAGAQYLQGLNQAAGNTTAAGQLGLANLGAQQGALNTMQSGYQAGNQNQLQAFQMFPALIQSMFAPSQAMIQAGQGLTGLSQQVLSDEEKRFYGQQQAPWTNLQQYMNAIGQPTTGSGSTTSPLLGPNAMSSAMGTIGGLNSMFGSGGLFGGGGGTGVGPGMDSLAMGGLGQIGGDFGGGGSALGGLGMLGSIGSFFSKFSDRRLKRDIEWIGKLPNGLPIYSFRYLWDDEPQIGLMADEVEAVHPEAVMTGPFGFKTVNYELACL